MPFIFEMDDAQDLFPDYEFVTALPQSSYKAAFHVRDQQGKDLCLKIISPECESQQLHREARAMQLISHPNVVQMLEYTFSSKSGDQRHFLIEEFIDGGDLKDHLGIAWERKRVSQVFSKLMDGLDQLRLKAIVHRDLKPTNIRLKGDDTPVIIDFGLSRHLQLSDLTATEEGAQKGTPTYFSPEQFVGTKHDIDHRTDLFAAGIILYEALVGRHPFYSNGDKWTDLQANVCEGDKHLLDPTYCALPDQWKLIVKKLLAKERSGRVNRADQVAAILRKLESVQMKRGAWHQLGSNHHKMVVEQLNNGAGVGIVMSPRDLKFNNAKDQIPAYKATGASVVIDPQWHVPGFSNSFLDDYPTSELRASVTKLLRISDLDLEKLEKKLVKENRDLKTDALIAPAVLYQAGKPEIVWLNQRLHEVAREAARKLSIPCYGTAFLGRSTTDSLSLLDKTISSITSLECDGWYFGFEFADERIPSQSEDLYRCLHAILLFALTGRSVMHAYAGPMGILSFAAGCEAAAAGADQKQWKLSLDRWDTNAVGGGGGKQIPRYFSSNLWGTILFPDETATLTSRLKASVFTSTPYAPVPPPLNWGQGWDAKKHLLFAVCKGIEHVSSKTDLEDARIEADKILETAVNLHSQILGHRRSALKDRTSCYQQNWRTALSNFAIRDEENLAFLDLLRQMLNFLTKYSSACDRSPFRSLSLD